MGFSLLIIDSKDMCITGLANGKIVAYGLINK